MRYLQDPVHTSTRNLHEGSSDSGLSSNSSACGSDESHLAKHDGDDVIDDAGYSSQSCSQTITRKHSAKVHPTQDTKSNKSEGSEHSTNHSSKDDEEPTSMAASETLLRHHEPEVASICSTASKASDVVGINSNSVDLSDVESVQSNNEVSTSLPKLDICSVEEPTAVQRILYNLYTISVSQ